MDVGALRALVLETNFNAHGVPVSIVAPESEAAIVTRGLWLTSIDNDAPEPYRIRGQKEFTRSDAKRVMVLRRSDVPEGIPRGTLIDASEHLGAPATRTWRVDAIDRVDVDKLHVIVLPVEA